MFRLFCNLDTVVYVAQNVQCHLVVVLVVVNGVCIGFLWESCRKSHAIENHALLPITCRSSMCRALTPARQAGRCTIYLPHRVDFGVGYVMRWFTCLLDINPAGS